MYVDLDFGLWVFVAEFTLWVLKLFGNWFGWLFYILFGWVLVVVYCCVLVYFCFELWLLTLYSWFIAWVALLLFCLPLVLRWVLLKRIVVNDFGIVWVSLGGVDFGSDVCCFEIVGFMVVCFLLFSLDVGLLIGYLILICRPWVFALLLY